MVYEMRDKVDLFNTKLGILRVPYRRSTSYANDKS